MFHNILYEYFSRTSFKSKLWHAGGNGRVAIYHGVIVKKVLWNRTYKQNLDQPKVLTILQVRFFARQYASLSLAFVHSSNFDCD